jgi:Domain of unknown function (DUF4365)
MDLNRQKAHLSIAYARAVVAAAGFNVFRMEEDEDSIDLGVAATAHRDMPRQPMLSVQLKCTAGRRPAGLTLPYELRMKNYEDLRADTIVPKILVVLVVPSRTRHWLRLSEDYLLLRRCGYWMSLQGHPALPNTHTTTVYLPRQQQFTPLSLQVIMARINSGESP